MTIKTKRTLATTLRCDARDVATIASFMDARGVMPETLGGVVREAIELLANTIRRQNPCYDVQLTTDAVDILRNLNLIDLIKKRQFRNHKTVLDELANESLSMEKPIHAPSPEAIQELRRNLERQTSSTGRVANLDDAKEVLKNLKRKKGD